jgi:hypothetical protein
MVALGRLASRPTAVMGVLARPGNSPRHLSRTADTLNMSKQTLLYSDITPRRVVLADVREVTPKHDGELLTPLIPLGDLHFSLTVAFDLARHGAVREDVGRYLNGNRLSDVQE